jgi:hypothetical protein
MVSLHRVNPSKQQKSNPQLERQSSGLAAPEKKSSVLVLKRCALHKKMLKLWNACAPHRIAKIKCFWLRHLYSESKKETRYCKERRSSRRSTPADVAKKNSPLMLLKLEKKSKE